MTSLDLHAETLTSIPPLLQIQPNLTVSIFLDHPVVLRKTFFQQVMKVRLGVEHWVKYMGIHMRFTLRSQLRNYFASPKSDLSDLLEQWKETKISTQMQLVVTHTLLGQILERDQLSKVEIVKILKEMKAFSIETIKSYGLNEIQKKREVAKLMQLEYYLDLFSKNKTCKKVLENFIVQYVWESQRKIIRVALSSGKWVPYGYEYNGQLPLFDPSMACDRTAFNILTAVTSSSGICVLNRDARKNQLKSICHIFGRPFFFVSAGVQDNFREALVGSVITNTWIYISIDDLISENRPLLRYK